MRHSSPWYIPPSVLLCAFFLLRSCSVASLRGSRYSRLRINNSTSAHFSARQETAEHRKLREESETNEGNATNGDEDSVEDWINMTEHEMVLEESFVDLRNLSLPENYGLDLGNEDPSYAASQIMDRITSNLEARMVKVFQKAKTNECRQKIARHFSYFINAIGKELSSPFAEFELENTCYFGGSDDGETVEDLERAEEESWKGYQPPRNDASYIDDPSDLNILYGILAHSDPDAVIRLVNALYEKGHKFVVHVDGKEASEDTQRQLVEFAESKEYVRILPDQNRVRVNWGAFSMVNATLQVLKYAFDHDLDFHKFAHLAESTYPVRSNAKIRQQLANYPIDANFMHIIKTPTNPHEDSWHYFVECDDAVHRIYRLPPIRWSNSGVDLMTSSQWFILSREFAKYLAESAPGTLVHDFLEYAEHMVVADEQFFGTVLRHTEFCHKHQNSNFLFLEFGKWEDSKEVEARDPRKCIMPDPNHCGRSPTSLKEDRIFALALSNKQPLFARKFVKDPNNQVKDIIDDILRDDSKEFDTTFKGDGILFVARDSIHSETPLCLGLGNKRSKVNLIPCFHHGVKNTIDSDWEYGGVKVDETLKTNRWRLGSCTFDGKLERTAKGEIVVTTGKYSKVGPLCTIEIMGGAESGNCLETSFGDESSNNSTRISPCNTKNNQFFSFGTGSSTPGGSIVVTSYSDGLTADSESRDSISPPICLGSIGDNDDVSGESEESDEDGDEDEVDEDIDEAYSGEEEGEEEYDDGAFDDEGEGDSEDDKSEKGTFVQSRRRLKEIAGGKKLDGPTPKLSSGPIFAMDCTDDGVIEWLIIPYVVENEYDDD